MAHRAKTPKPVKRNNAMAPPRTTTEEDTFGTICLSVWEGLSDAVRELGWIADGISDTSTSFSDRSLANLRRLEYKDKIKEIQEKYIAYKAKKLIVTPPSSGQMAEAVRIASDLAQWSTVNVTATAVIASATGLLNIYNNATRAS